jgi:transcriptional regulator GlxA family with amidase domain
MKGREMKSSIVIFDQFTDIDLFLMWDLLNRVRLPGWEVRILGERSHHVSTTGIEVPTHGLIEEANHSDVVLFVSGQGTRTKMKDQDWLSRFQLKPGKQMIGSICSGALALAALGLLEGKTATTYPTVKQTLESFGVTVEEKPFIEHGYIATAGGCLAAQYLVGWVIEKKADAEWKRLILKSIKPVGEGLSFADSPDLGRLYVPVSSAQSQGQ